MGSARGEGVTASLVLSVLIASLRGGSPLP